MSVEDKMDSENLTKLLECLDGSGSDAEWSAAKELRTLGLELPTLLLKRFRWVRSWKARSSCVYHAMRYAKTSDDAFLLGVEAIKDKSKAVRYRGAMLLAYSQRADALPSLRAALHSLNGRPGADDLMAAIDAIESGNHHFFVDRTHSGKMKLTIE